MFWLRGFRCVGLTAEWLGTLDEAPHLLRREAVGGEMETDTHAQDSERRVWEDARAGRLLQRLRPSPRDPGPGWAARPRTARGRGKAGPR